METASLPLKESPSGSDASLTLEDAVRRVLELDDEFERQQWILHCLALYDTDQLASLFKSESDRYRYIDPDLSIRLGKSLIAMGEAMNRLDHQALGMGQIGDMYREIGRYQESVQMMDDAGALWLVHGDEAGWARTRIPWMWSSHRLGNGVEALAVGERARDILVKRGLWIRVAAFDLNAGWVCYEMGQNDRALRYYERAREEYASLGAEGAWGVAVTKLNTAILLWVMGDFHEGLRLHEEARQFFEQKWREDLFAQGGK